MESGFEVKFRLHDTLLHMFRQVDHWEIVDEYGGDVVMRFHENPDGEIALESIHGSVTGIMQVSIGLLESEHRAMHLDVWNARLWLGPVLARIVSYDPYTCYLYCEWLNYKELGYGDSK